VKPAGTDEIIFASFFKHVTSLYYNVHFSVSRKNKDDGGTMSVACLLNKLLNHCELLKKK